MTTLDSSQWMYSSASEFYSHTIDQSLRFEDGDSAHLDRTMSTGNRKTFTHSLWFKRGNLGSRQVLVSARGGDGTKGHVLEIEAADNITFFDTGAAETVSLDTSAKFRDVGSWYHLVLRIDTTQSTSSNRVRLYINGELISLSGTQPSQNGDMQFNKSSEQHRIGARNDGFYFDGYIAEFNYVDGQSLDPTSFGETKAGIWIPKDTSGLTFGTNGFRLKFQDSSALGDDTSGNGNDFTASGLAATDVVLDSPTNNFATMNPLVPATDFTFAEGNLKATVGSTAWDTTASTYFLNSGKWYAEFHILDTNRVAVGAVSNLYDPTTYIGNNTEGIGYYDQGYTYGSGANVTTGLTTFTNGDLIQVALNLDDNEISFYKANTLIKTENLPSSTGQDFSIAVSGYGSGSGAIVNFGQDSSFAGNETAQGNTDGNGNGDFYYSPPSGYLALCTANLPNPGIDPAQDEEPADNFNTVLYTGDGSGSQAITGVGFQPDWVWAKARSIAYSHRWYDSVRGTSKALYSSQTNAETTENGVTSFDSDGFTAGHAGTNGSGQTFVAWNWLAGGSASSNSNGSITSSVSANTKAGFSIVTYTGNATAGATVGHGLSSTPEMYIVKSRSLTTGWVTYHKDMASSPEDGYLALQATDAFFDTIVWNDTPPTSSVFSVAATGYSSNNSGATYVAYCFHSVEGYSKFGSYTGNGSTDGPFVYTGFRPAFLLMKRTDSTSNWYTWDAKRDVDNGIRLYIRPNLANAEGGTSSGQQYFDFLSNGFKIVANSSAFADGNTSGGSYIYLAFAEQPFKYSNAR